MIETIAAAGASDLARALWNRYCDFTEVYRLSMEELAGGNSDSSPVQPPATRRANRGVLSPAQRSTSRLTRRGTASRSSLTKCTSDTSKVADPVVSE